jgi:Ulp1 family protease
MRSKGKTKIGAIFNLDPHYKGGSHWVGLFIDLDAHEISYFDSYGIAPPQQIARFMRSLTLQDKALKLQSNGRRFQYKGSECGVYSMIFVLSMLTGQKFRNFVKHPISDDDAQEFRKFLFRS